MMCIRLCPPLIYFHYTLENSAMAVSRIYQIADEIVNDISFHFLTQRSVGYLLANSNIKEGGESTVILLLCSLVKLNSPSLSFIV
jgi:hypothetical protein